MVETLLNHNQELDQVGQESIEDIQPTRRNNNFILLDQQGPFQMPEQVDLNPHNLAWVRSLNPAERARYAMYKDTALQMLEIPTLSDIHNLKHDQARVDQISRDVYKKVGNMYGIEGDVEAAVNNYANVADGVVDHMRTHILPRYASYFEMTNEVNAISNPVALMMIAFDDDYSQKARFEAKRKLELMHLAGAIDQRERESGLEDKYKTFLDFMNKHVWDPELKIGQTVDSYALSEHSGKDFSCESVTILSPEQANNTEVQAGQKLTLLKRRRFVTENGDRIPAYVTIRQKAEESRVLKLLRKGQENPAVAVEDDMGMMGVFNSKADIRRFQEHLIQAARKAGSFIMTEEIHDSLHGKNGKDDNPNSSSSIEMMKYFIRVNGIRVEMVLHTNSTYLDYLYQRETSHGEYEVRRLFDTGVVDLMFPQDIYGIDTDAIRGEQIEAIRSDIENPQRVF